MADFVPLNRLALWCPYCDDIVNPKRCTDVDLPAVLACPLCDRSIAHADWHVGEDREAVGQILARLPQVP